MNEKIDIKCYLPPKSYEGICEICEREISDNLPGKVIHFSSRPGRPVYVCNSCFMDRDYQEIISSDKTKKISNY